MNKEETKEEMDEDGEEEIKDDSREYPYATIARIDVAPNPFPLKKGARISTGGVEEWFFLRQVPSKKVRTLGARGWLATPLERPGELHREARQWRHREFTQV